MTIFDKHTLLTMNILEEMGLESLPEKDKDELLEAMAEILGRRITLRAIEALSDADAEVFSRLVENEPEKAGQFLVDRVPNAAELIQDEIAKFKSEMVSEFGAA